MEKCIFRFFLVLNLVPGPFSGFPAHPLLDCNSFTTYIYIYIYFIYIYIYIYPFYFIRRRRRESENLREIRLVLKLVPEKNEKFTFPFF